jgi:tetratricopeptide (TPR) repeat protein
MQQHFEKALNIYQDCLALARERSDLRLEMIVLANSAALYLSKGEWDKSIELSKTALPMAIEVGETTFRTTIQGNLGYALWQQGKHHEAERIYREHVVLLFEEGNLPHFVENSFELAYFWYQLNQKAAAVSLWGAAEQLRQRHQYPQFTGYQKIKDEILSALPETECTTLLDAVKNPSSAEVIKLIRTRGQNIAF